METVSLARYYCPTCEPDADPFTEILDVRWCGNHSPDATGSEDVLVDYQSYIGGSAESDGETNRRFAEVLHKNSPYRKKKRKKEVA